MPPTAPNPAFALPLPVDPAAAATPGEIHDTVLRLFDEHHAGVTRYVRSLGLGPTETEDVVQDVFLALCRHLHRDGRRLNLSAWVFRVAHNIALKRRAREVRWLRIRALTGWPVAAAPTPEQQFFAGRRRSRFDLVIQALPERDRRCFVLRAEGLRYRAIAAVLGVSLGTVAAALTRVVGRLQRADEV